MVPSGYTGPSHHAYVSKRYQKFESQINDPTASLSSSKSSRSSKRNSIMSTSSSIRSSISRFNCFSPSHPQDTTPSMPQPPMTIVVPASNRPVSTYSIASSQGPSSPLASPLHSPMQSPLTSPMPLLHGMRLPSTSSAASTSDDGSRLSAVQARRPLSGDAGYSALRDDIQRRRRTLLVAMEMEDKRRSGSEGQWTAERSE